MTEKKLRDMIEKECKYGNRKVFMLWCYNRWLNIGDNGKPSLLVDDVEWDEIG